jgi:hypothetical protein
MKQFNNLKNAQGMEGDQAPIFDYQSITEVK